MVARRSGQDPPIEGSERCRWQPSRGAKYDRVVIASRRTTVLYDGDCGFCIWVMRELRRLDRRRLLTWVPLQMASMRADRPDLAAVAKARPLEREIHVVLPDGSVRTGGRAMLEILQLMPGGWLLRTWTRLPGAVSLTELAYRHVAAHRHALGRLVRPDRGASAWDVDAPSPAP